MAFSRPSGRASRRQGSPVAISAVRWIISASTHSFTCAVIRCGIQWNIGRTARPVVLILPVEIRPTAVVPAEVRTEAPGGDQPAGGLGVVRLRARQLGLEDPEDRGPPPPLPLRLPLVQAQDVAPAALALAEHPLLGPQAGRDVGVTARVG